jgi:hypothetical protein
MQLQQLADEVIDETKPDVADWHFSDVQLRLLI